VVPVTVRLYVVFTNEPVPVISRLPPTVIVPPEFTVPLPVILTLETVGSVPVRSAEAVEPKSTILKLWLLVVIA